MDISYQPDDQAAQGFLARLRKRQIDNFAQTGEYDAQERTMPEPVAVSSAQAGGEVKPVYRPTVAMGAPVDDEAVRAQSPAIGYNPPANDPDRLPAPGSPAYNEATASAMRVPAGPRITYNENGSPVGATGGDSQLERDRALIEEQENYQPSNHNSRIAGAGATAGRGLRQGGLVGAAAGLVRGLFNKKADEQDAAAEALGQTRVRYAQDAQMRDSDTNNAYKQAEAQRALQPAYHPPVPTDQGMMEIGADGKVRPLMGPSGQPLTRTRTTRIDKPTKIIAGANGRQERWEVDEKGNPTKQVSVLTDKGNWVAPGSAEIADATRSHQETEDKLRATRDNETKAGKLRSARAASVLAGRTMGEHATARQTLLAEQTSLQNALNNRVAAGMKDKMYRPEDDAEAKGMQNRISAINAELLHHQTEYDSAKKQKDKADALAQTGGEDPAHIFSDPDPE